MTVGFITAAYTGVHGQSVLLEAVRILEVAGVHFRIEGVWVMPTNRPSGPSIRVTTWPQGSFRVATSNS